MLVLATPQVECLPASTRSQPRWRASVQAQTFAKRVARDLVSHFRRMHAGAGRAGREKAPHTRGVRQDDRDAGVGSRQVEGAFSGRALLASLAQSCCNTCIQAGMCRTQLSSHLQVPLGPVLLESLNARLSAADTQLAPQVCWNHGGERTQPPRDPVAPSW